MRFNTSPKILAPLALAALAAFSQHAGAAVVINVIQNGANIQIVATGSINLASTVSKSTSTGSGARHDFYSMFGGGNTILGVTPSDTERYDLSNLTIVDGSLEAAQFFKFSIGGDPTKGVIIDGPTLTLPVGYVSGAPLDFTAFITNSNFNNEGIGDGNFDGDFMAVSWSNEGISDSITVNFSVVPEPSSMICALSGTLFLLHRRRK